jgi:hypothetical protein
LEAKQKRRKLWRTLDMQPVSARAELAIGNEVVDANLVDEVEGGGVCKSARYVVEDMEEDEEGEPPQVRRGRRSKAQSDASSLTAPARMMII